MSQVQIQAQSKYHAKKMQPPQSPMGETASHGLVHQLLSVEVEVGQHDFGDQHSFEHHHVNTMETFGT